MYYYFVSSLPMLSFGMKPPFSLQVFLNMCRDQLSGKDVEMIRRDDGSDIARRYNGFDIRLRNELVKVRASRRHAEASRYLRGDGYADPAVTHIALSAHRNPSILESERFLDQERWNFLNELETGHYFDLGFLAVYMYRLMILERWDKIRLADREALLERTLENPQG
jgi:hypothetical protein